VDFGKWASSLGLEGNYTKDQTNYSRSYWFNFLPFYHMGARLNYKLNDKIALNYWITNGTQQTEPFNGFKDQLFGLNIQPHKNVAWTLNYSSTRCLAQANRVYRGRLSRRQLNGPVWHVD
jgi:hypothetical protein